MKQWIKWLVWIPPVFWMVVIFMFSASDATESSSLSGGVSENVVEWVDEVFSLDWDTEYEQTICEKIEFPIRKIAHMSEYAVLAILFCIAFTVSEQVPRRRYLVVIACCFLYACTDEFHQRFVPGRDGNLLDVAIDTIGATIGVIVALIGIGVINRIRKRKKS